MWRINKISICNLKGFKKEFTVNVNSDNVLIFGENGSGKSSIYWSVYTHYEAHATSMEDAGKYFKHGHPQNLRNRFCDPADDSYITISFANGADATLEVTDSGSNYYCNDPQIRNFMRDTAITSDFMNYKFLASLFDFTNSSDNDVYPMFRKQVFPVLNFNGQFNGIDDQSLPSSNAAFLWDYLHDNIRNLPLNQKQAIDLTSSQYRAYIRLLNRFNEALNSQLGGIIMAANIKLHDIFHVEADVVLKYSKAEFNLIYPDRKKSRDKKLHDPKILLHARMTTPGVKNADVITHPKSFFNEAKITSMALAIRLAILETRSPVDIAPSTIFFDDILISLDMSLRRLVIPVILNYAESRQLFILTHDRALFYLWQEAIDHRKQEINRINDRIKEENELLAEDEKKELLKTPKWRILELYSIFEDGTPSSKFIDSKSYLENARLHLDALRIHECANSLRRACEKELKRILPLNEQYEVPRKSSDAGGAVDLNGLIEKFVKFRGELDLPDDFRQLDNDRKLIMNPYSHDDIETPFYREELRKCIDVVTLLQSIVPSKLIETDDVVNKEFQIKAINGRFSCSAIVRFLEETTIWTYKGKKYCFNARIEVIDCEKEKLKSPKIQNLRSFFNKLTHEAGIKADDRPFIADCISPSPPVPTALP